MRGSKVLGFILLRSAFTKSNTSAAALVGIFVFVYSIAGGNVRIPTNIKAGDSFGSVASDEPPAPEGLEGLEGLGEGGSDVPAAEPVRNNEDRADAQSVIGVLPSESESARMREIDKRGRLFDANTPEEDGEDGKPINRDGLVKGVEFTSHREEWMMLRSEKRKVDGLSAIEDRLDVKRVRKKKFPVSTGDPN